MKNPVSVSSQDVTQFGFKASFDFSLRKIVFDISDLTVFVNEATDVNSIVFNVKDPNGYSYPPVSINLNTLAPVDISLGNLINFGPFTIEAVLIDSQGKSTKIVLDKNICAPENWDGKNVPGQFDVQVNCKIPRVKITEKSICAYMGMQPISSSKSGKLFYPDNVINELDFTATPFTIGENSGIYTGTYRIKSTTLNTYDLGDNVFVKIPFQTRQEFDVTCESSLNSILCCVSDVYQTYINNRSNTSGSSSKAKLESISTDLMVALLKDQTGKDNSVELNKIKSILNCDCGCDNVSYIEPNWLSGGNGGNINIQGEGGSSVSSSISGDTTQYIVTSKEVSVVKGNPNDLSFSIATNKTATTALFSIEFDYVKLSQTILNTIASDQSLTILLNQIVTSSSGVMISNVDGKCVIDLSTADYLLTESAAALKTVVNIVVGPTTYSAPTGLSSINTVAIKSWLDSLSIGTFSVSLNGEGNQLTVASSNTNPLSTMSFNNNGNITTKQFSKNTGSISDILQAMIDYICAINAGHVDLQNQISITRLEAGTPVTTNYDVGSSLQTYLEALAIALTYYANNPLQGPPGTNGTNGISVQVFVQPTEPTGTLRNGDIWIVQ